MPSFTGVEEAEIEMSAVKLSSGVRKEKELQSLKMPGMKTDRSA